MAKHKDMTLEYMEKYGIDNVRGWAWATKVLSNTPTETPWSASLQSEQRL